MRVNNQIARAKGRLSPSASGDSSGNERDLYRRVRSPLPGSSLNFHLSSVKQGLENHYLQIPNHASVRNTTAKGQSGIQQWTASPTRSNEDLMRELKDSLEPSNFTSKTTLFNESKSRSGSPNLMASLGYSYIKRPVGGRNSQQAVLNTISRV